MSKQEKKEAKVSKTKAKDTRVEDLTNDLQRLRADFENYRKRVDEEKVAARGYGAASMVEKLLPILDNIDRAIKNVPKEIESNAWVQGVEGLGRKMGTLLTDIGLERIDANPGTEFDHLVHHAIQMDDAEGEIEVIAEEVQPGYKLNGEVLRESAVRVTKKKQ